VKGRLLGLGAVLLVALSLLAFGVGGFVRVSRMKQEMRALERDLASLRVRGEALPQTIECLRNDPLCIEKSAREDLGMARQGETILRFPSRGAQ
jgi:cell division protein FtsB